MKNLALTLALSLGIATVSFAQEAKVATNVQEQPEKKEIKMNDVPAAVQESFRDDSEDKTVKSIHQVAGQEGANYEFIVEKDGETKALTYNANGEKIDKKKVKK